MTVIIVMGLFCLLICVVGFFIIINMLNSNIENLNKCNEIENIYKDEFKNKIDINTSILSSEILAKKLNCRNKSNSEDDNSFMRCDELEDYVLNKYMKNKK
jgi:uncharacterized membrane protein YfhO